MSLQKRLKQYNSGLSKELLQLKYDALGESPFRFYRGTCNLFAEDFFKLWKSKPKVTTWICGDAHVENYGTYKGDDRNIYFDLNDFDESILGFPELELTRFLTSVIVASGNFGTNILSTGKLVGDAMEKYCEVVQGRKGRVVTASGGVKELNEFFTGMSSINRSEFIARRTEKKDGTLQIKTDGKKYTSIPESEKLALQEQLMPALSKDSRFRQLVFEDVAFRIAGTASLGLKRYGFLFYSSKKGKRYLIDVKQARDSVYKPFVTGKQPRFANEAERIVKVGYLSQFAAPAFVTQESIDSKWFVVRELQPTADRMSLTYFGADHGLFARVVLLMAELIASAHLRSSGHLGADPADKLVRFTEKAQWQRDTIELSNILALRNDKYYNAFLQKK